ncbi:MAG TPA: hypothetical protein VF627_04695 [Abditibacterium sp.]|jgi:hypothetical protein
MFVINDESHAEWMGEHDTFESALAQIQDWTALVWSQAPNVAPCQSWRTCGRSYEIQQWDNTVKPWTLIESTPIVEIDARGVRWEPEFAPDSS